MTRPLTTLFLSIFLIAPIPALAQEADLDLIPAENDVASSTNPITTLDSSPASDSAIGSEDFDQVGSTEQVDSDQRKDITSISTSAYLDFTLNATGQGNVSKTGVSKFGLREGHDITNTAYDGNTNNSNRINFSAADETGTTQDPKLTVETDAGGSDPVTGVGIQNSRFTYDAVGNILQIVNNSNTSAQATTTYAYDDLYRLTSASTTQATSTPYTQTFLYTALGNIATSTKGAQNWGYSYLGTSYANPHAVTQIASSTATTTYAYDQSGNLTSTGSQTNTWDYQSRLTTVYASSYPSTFYQYDHTTARVAKGSGTATTTYTSKYYELISATSTKYIWAGDTLLATIEGNGTATTTSYMHGDHLGSTNVVTNASGNVVSTTDYYPYGAKRIDSNSNLIDRQFIGQRYDSSADLNYLNARYYQSGRGQFLSQDPTFWSGRQNIFDPQSLNSYSYANGNPITGKDPLGLFNIKTGAVEKGDTLSKITSLLNQTYGTNNSVNQIASLNKISNPNLIFPGQTIKPNNSVPDVTRSLNNVNQLHGAQARGPVVTGPTTANSTAAATGMGTLEFAGKVRPGGSWDLKAQGQDVEGGVFCQRAICGGQRAENYIFNAQEVPGDAPGNIHYGYVGKEADYSLGTLLFFGGAVQTITHPGQFGDPGSDKYFIRQGYGLQY